MPYVRFDLSSLDMIEFDLQVSYYLHKFFIDAFEAVVVWFVLSPNDNCDVGTYFDDSVDPTFPVLVLLVNVPNGLEIWIGWLLLVIVANGLTIGTDGVDDMNGLVVATLVEAAVAENPNEKGPDVNGLFCNVAVFVTTELDFEIFRSLRGTSQDAHIFTSGLLRT